MSASFVQVPPNSTGLKVDTSELVSGSNTVERQNICIADPATAANIATVSAGGALTVAGAVTVASTTVTGNVTAVQATGTNLHVVVDTAPTTAVTIATAPVLVAGSAVIGKVGIDQTTPGTTNLVQVGGSLPAGTAVIGHVIADTGSTTAVTGTVTVAGAVTEATLDAAIVAQEATTSGVKGLTAFGAVTTAKPTYTTAKSDALSLDVNGLLRVSVADTPANTNKFLVTADAVTFASPQHIIADSGTITTVSAVTAITNALPTGANTIGSVKITDGTTVPGVIAGTTALKTDQSSQAGTAVTTVPVAFGSGTPSGNAPGVNSALFAGTTAVRSNQTTTATGAVDVNIVGSLGVTNSVTNGSFAAITDNTTKVGVIAGTTALKTDLSSVAGTATVTAAAGVQKVGIVGNANATIDTAVGTLPTNNLAAICVPSAGAGAALTSKVFSAQATAVNVKASAGNLYGFAIVSATATAGFVMFFNTATTATTPTVWAIPIAASGTVIITPSQIALMNFSTGIAINVATPINGTTTQITWTGTVMYF